MGHFIPARENRSIPIGMEWTIPFQPEWNGSFHYGQSEQVHTSWEPASYQLEVSYPLSWAVFLAGCGWIPLLANPLGWSDGLLAGLTVMIMLLSPALAWLSLATFVDCKKNFHQSFF